MENLKVSEDYKKAYNHADMICTYAPGWLKDIKAPEKVSNEYAKGFQDRIRQFEKERDTKYFSYQKLHEKYGTDLDNPNKDQTKGMDKEK